MQHHSELAMDLNTEAGLLLIASYMAQVYPHLTIRHRVCKIIPISGASAK